MNADMDSLCICCVCELAKRDLRLLDCLHNCCFDCVQNTKCDEVVTCLKCAFETSVSSCCPNTFLNMCTSLSTNFSDTKQCSVCPTLGTCTDADIVCLDCGQALCGSCRRYHDVFHPSHTVERSADPREEAGTSNWLCQRHGTRQEYFCTNCDRVMCAMCDRECFKEQHDINTLKPGDVTAIVARARERLESAITLFECVVPTTELIAKCRSDLSEMRKDCYDKITRKKWNLLHCIEIEYSNALQTMNELADKMEEDLFAKQEEAGRLEDVSQVALTYARHLLDSQMYRPLLDQQERLLMRFENLLVERANHIESTRNSQRKTLTIFEEDTDYDLFKSTIKDKLGIPQVTTVKDDSTSQHSSSAVSSVYDVETSTTSDIESQRRITEHSTSDDVVLLEPHPSEMPNEEQMRCLKVTRRLSERYLLQPEYTKGAFLLRQSVSKPGLLVLSVRNEITDSEPSIQHYLISKTPRGRFYLDEERRFDSLAQLIGHFKSSEGGLCCRLSIPYRYDKQDAIDVQASETDVNAAFDDYSVSTTKLLKNVLPGDEFHVTWSDDNSEDILHEKTKKQSSTEFDQRKDLIYEDTELEAAHFTEALGNVDVQTVIQDKHVSENNNNTALHTDSNICFQDISRKRAEEYLLSPEHSLGTFLIRDSESKPGCFSLSIRHVGPEGSPQVKHYVIFKSSNGMLYMYKGDEFQTLEKLIEGYKSSLCTTLSAPLLPKDYADKRTSEVSRNMTKTVKAIKKLSAGYSCELWEGTWWNSTKVAIKIEKPNTVSGLWFLNEANIMKKCCHCNIVKMYALGSKGKQSCIIMELLPHGDLLSYLRKSEKRQSIAEVVDMAAQISNGMSYLKDVHVVHGDVAARNILVGNNKELKIADFGLANILEESKDFYVAKKGSKFPIKWSAPEVIEEGKFSFMSDVWSFGITIMEIVTKGRTPYAGMTNAQVIEEIKKGYRMPRPEECERDIYKIMMRCWHSNPNKRPSFKTLHSVFTSYLDGCYIQWNDYKDATTA